MKLNKVLFTMLISSFLFLLKINAYDLKIASSGNNNFDSSNNLIVWRNENKTSSYLCLNKGLHMSVKWQLNKMSTGGSNRFYISQNDLNFYSNKVIAGYKKYKAEGGTKNLKDFINTVNSFPVNYSNEDKKAFMSMQWCYWDSSCQSNTNSITENGKKYTVAMDVYKVIREDVCQYVNGKVTYNPSCKTDDNVQKLGYVKITSETVVQGSLKLKKIDGDTGSGIYGVTFKLEGNGRTYTCNTNTSGICTINDILPGYYTLKETQQAKYYPTNNGSWSITITANSTNDYYYNHPITNTKTCVSEFEDNVNKRLELYKKYQLNNLLNFNIHSAKDACTTISCQKTSSISCLNYSSSINSFDQYNLSCYDDTIEVNNVTGYCVELFDFNNSFNSSDNYNFGTINSGQLIIKQDIAKIGTGTLKKVCYLPNTQNSYNGTFDYTDYVSNVKLQDVSLIHDNKIISLIKDNYVSNGFIRYTSTTDVEYFLPKVFSSIGSGKKIYNKTCTNCRFLGYGIIGNINLAEGEHYLSFNVNLDINKLKAENVSSKSCSYNVKNNITTCEDNDCKSQKLNLEFRTVDTNNPFPGKSGSSRETGENWCDNDSCASKNQNVCSNIVNKKNSYTSGTAKYTIILNSDEISKIRQDNSLNKNNGISYDDFSTLQCDEYNDCTSNYLDQLKNRTISDKSGSTYVFAEDEDYDSKLTQDNSICE